ETEPVDAFRLDFDEQRHVRVFVEQRDDRRQAWYARAFEAAAEAPPFTDIDVLKLCVGAVVHASRHASGSSERGIVQDDRDGVSGQLHIQLEMLDAQRQRRQKCRQRVLRTVASVSSMGDDLHSGSLRYTGSILGGLT